MFEERLVKAMICLPTYNKAHHLWVQYWPVMIDPNNGPIANEANKRKTKYEKHIHKSFEEQSKLVQLQQQK